MSGGFRELLTNQASVFSVSARILLWRRGRFHVHPCHPELLEQRAVRPRLCHECLSAQAVVTSSPHAEWPIRKGPSDSRRSAPGMPWSTACFMQPGSRAVVRAARSSSEAPIVESGVVAGDLPRAVMRAWNGAARPASSAASCACVGGRRLMAGFKRSSAATDSIRSTSKVTMISPASNRPIRPPCRTVTHLGQRPSLMTIAVPIALSNRLATHSSGGSDARRDHDCCGRVIY